MESEDSEESESTFDTDCSPTGVSHSLIPMDHISMPDLARNESTEVEENPMPDVDSFHDNSSSNKEDSGAL